MKTLLHVELDEENDAVIVSGEISTAEELSCLAVALANLFYTEDDLSEATMDALDAITKKIEKQIHLNLQEITSKQFKS